MRCAHGLAELVMCRYKSAAISFLLCSFDNCENPDLISTQNVAVYGVLCAMATFNRNELYQKVNSKLIRFKVDKLYLVSPQMFNRSQTFQYLHVDNGFSGYDVTKLQIVSGTRPTVARSVKQFLRFKI